MRNFYPDVNGEDIYTRRGFFLYTRRNKIRDEISVAVFAAAKKGLVYRGPEYNELVDISFKKIPNPVSASEIRLIRINDLLWYVVPIITTTGTYFIVFNRNTHAEFVLRGVVHLFNNERVLLNR